MHDPICVDFVVNPSTLTILHVKPSKESGPIIKCMVQILHFYEIGCPTILAALIMSEFKLSFIHGMNHEQYHKVICEEASLEALHKCISSPKHHLSGLWCINVQLLPMPRA